MSESRAHRVVIVGGGFGGLFAARFLKRADADVTVIDRRNHHLFQPLLYQVSTGILSEGEVAPPIRDILRRYRNVRVELATVTGFDLRRKIVTATRPDGSARTYPYDSLIVAAGAGQSYFGHDEFCRWAPGMKTINDALELRGRIFGYLAAECCYVPLIPWELCARCHEERIGRERGGAIPAFPTIGRQNGQRSACRVWMAISGRGALHVGHRASWPGMLSQ